MMEWKGLAYALTPVVALLTVVVVAFVLYYMVM